MDKLGFSFDDDNGKKRIPLWVKVSTVIIAIIVFILFMNFVISLFFTDEEYNINNIPLIRADSIVIKKFINDNTKSEEMTLSIYDEINKSDNAKKKEFAIIKSNTDDIFIDQRLLENKINEIIANDVVVEKVEVETEKEEPKKPIKINFKTVAKKNNTEPSIDVIKNKALLNNIKNGKDVKSSNVKVQLISLKSRDAIEKFFKKVKNENKKLFDGKKYYVEESNLKSIGDIYRLQIGDFNDDREALDFCNEYTRSRKESVSCILVKR